jgi:hypothetical protein
MPEERSKRTETEDLTRMDSVLGLLGGLSKRDPSPAVRERLAVLASERLNQSPRRHGRGPRVWWKPAFAAACLVVAGLATGLAVYFNQRGPVKNNGTARGEPPVVSSEIKVHSVPAVRPSVNKPAKARHSRPSPVEPTGLQQLTMRLPYSNGAIETGTGTTIRVSMSQSDLLSLGFPINRTVRDRRIVADLALGDDGLPRAISVPLPLEVMKERR